MTTYQVRHITGDGMGRRYTPPECSTMRTNGLCVDQDSLCQSGIRHPLSYYRAKFRRSRKEKEEKTVEVEAPPPAKTRKKAPQKAAK
jgi:DNA primase large subunit